MPPSHKTTNSITSLSIQSGSNHSNSSSDNNNYNNNNNKKEKQKQRRGRSKHIEVCVRLRPLVVQSDTSSRSFFMNNGNGSSKYKNKTQRKPAIPRPASSSNSNRSLKSPNKSSSSSSNNNSTNNNDSKVQVPIYAWNVVENDTVVQNPETDIVQGRTHTYTLDHVYGPETVTKELYDNSVQDLVHAAMEGYHTAVLAYGQTSTGKTHTMTGTATEPGLIPLAIKECFTWLKDTREYLIRLSYLEVYKEHIKDLLNPVTEPIRLYETKDNKLQIKGLREEIVTTPEQVFTYLAQGETRRQVGATHLNQHSSRSHVIVRLWIESTTSSTIGSSSSNNNTRLSSLSLVDLAGSESVKLSNNTDRRAEGHYINKSLMTLGQVVNALAADSTDSSSTIKQHVPYRDSKLTRLLQPSLSGNAQVVLICCISPHVYHIEESHNTYKFAVRAKKIPQKAIKDITDEKTLLQSYRDEISTLKQQLKEAQEQQQQLIQKQQTQSNNNNNNQQQQQQDNGNNNYYINTTISEDADEEVQELIQAIQNMEKLILNKSKSNTNNTGSPPETPATMTGSTTSISLEEELSNNHNYSGLEEFALPTTPVSATDGNNNNNNTLAIVETDNIIPKDFILNNENNNNNNGLQTELTRIQGLLNSVLKKRRSNNVRIETLRAELEKQDVITSLRQADSTFLQKQLIEKDNLLIEVSKLLENVEEKQIQLETENKMLKQEIVLLKRTNNIATAGRRLLEF